MNFFSLLQYILSTTWEGMLIETGRYASKWFFHKAKKSLPTRCPIWSLGIGIGGHHILQTLLNNSGSGKSKSYKSRQLSYHLLSSSPRCRLSSSISFLLLLWQKWFWSTLRCPLLFCNQPSSHLQSIPNRCIHSIWFNVHFKLPLEDMKKKKPSST